MKNLYVLFGYPSVLPLNINLRIFFLDSDSYETQQPHEIKKLKKPKKKILTLLQNLTNTLENIIKLDEGDQKSFELALFSKNIMDMERGPEVLLITAILTEEQNSKPRHSVAFSGVFFGTGDA